MKVFVVAMSAPAAKYCRWISSTTSGLVRLSRSGIAGDVARVILEPLAAICLLAAHLPLNQDAPRPVEHGDALAEDGL